MNKFKKIPLLLIFCLLLNQLIGISPSVESLLGKKVYASDTGAKTAGSFTAVTVNAGDNNGFELPFGTSLPIDTTTSNNSGSQSVNSGSGTSSNCVLPNTVSDQHDFSDFSISIPAGAQVKGIEVSIEAKYDSNSGTNTLCSFLSSNGGVDWTTGRQTGDIQQTDSINTLGGATDLWGRSSWSSDEFNNTNFKLRLMALVANNMRDASIDHLTVRVYYNQLPGIPSQDSPVNNAIAISTIPNFTMTATDPDTDNLSYKVTIYSDSACTNIVQTNDQSISATGWSGTNAVCVNSPTSCYASGTQASFQTQTSLSANTQYWWKASVKDPDGSGVFTNSSACNSFTTALVSISVADGIVNYGMVPLGSSRDTTTGGINDTQIVTNDGNATENINIKGENSENWVLGGSVGTNIYKHEFCKTGTGLSDPCDANPVWNALTTSYQSLSSNVLVNGTQKFDLQLIMPTSTSSYSEQSVDVTIQATTP